MTNTLARFRRIEALAAGAVLSALSLAAAAVAQAQAPASPVLVRTLRTVSTSTDTVGALSGARELSDGRLLVNDAKSRRLLMFDPTLGEATVITTGDAGGVFPYGTRGSLIMPFSGDSTLFVDVAGRTLLVLSGEGKVVRLMSAPRPFDVPNLANGNPGSTRVDASGRLIYRTQLFPNFKAPEVGKRYDPPSMADSAPLLRVDFDTRRADTVAWLRTMKIKVATTVLPNGGVRLAMKGNPLHVYDDWASFEDGTIAVIRGQDYHVDWIGPDGKRWSTPKLPFAWRRVTDEEKVAMLDSTRRALEAQARGERAAAAAAGGAAGAGGAGQHGGGAPASGAQGGSSNHSMTMMPVTASDGGPTPRSESASAVTTADVTVEVVEPSDLPDYYPSLQRAGLVRADPSGNLWILPATSALTGQGPQGLVYDVVNREGKLVQRVRLPVGRTLEAFGQGGNVYLAAFTPTGVRVERARLEP